MTKLLAVVLCACCIVAGQAESAHAETVRYKVIWSISGLEDLSRTSECDDIDVNFTDEFFEDEEAVTIGKAVILRELEDVRHGVGISYRLRSVKAQKGCWYLSYNWLYKSELKNKDFHKKFFNIKIDFPKRQVVYEKTHDQPY